MNKTFKLEINDIFQDIKDENNRLLREIKFSQKLFEVIQNYRNLVNNCLNCGPNEETKTKFTELDTSLINDLNLAKQQFLIVCQTNQSNDYKYFDDRNEDPIKTSDIEDLKSIRFVSQLETESNLYRMKSSLKCDLCPNISFSEEYYLVLHLKTNHLNKGIEDKYYCCDHKSCNYKTKNISIFNGHRIGHSRRESVKSLGLKKQKATSSNYNTNNDEINSKQHYFHCKQCSKSYKQRQHLLRHCRQRHPNCDQKLVSEQSLELSQKYKSSDNITQRDNSSENLVPKPKRKKWNRSKNRPFNCHLCRRHFSEEYILNLHINTIHSESDSKERYFCCDYKECKYKTQNLNVFKDHRKRHLANKEVSCLWPSCDHMFVTTEDMKKHLITHQDIRKYSCVWPGCQSSFKTQQSMKRHMDVHTSSPDQLPCDWPECQKRFRNLRQMKRHLLTVHNRVRKFVCHWPQCGKQFANQSQLQTHLTVHSGLRPHTCPQEGCHKTFADKSNMYKHIRLIHKKP